jgi:cyclopropane fatty-acyl-phospholipid synthase-like methyltransferase
MTSHGRGHFQRIYEAGKDPWNYQSSPYEKAKRDATIAALAGRRFRSGLEVGCSIGELTHRLADHCDQLLGVDFIDEALAVARVRCVNEAWVSFRNVQVPREWPEGRFDLIVLSEVLYFLSSEDGRKVVTRCKRYLTAAGVILLVNWLDKSPDDPCSGDAAAARFIETGRDWLRVGFNQRTERYRLDRLEAHISTASAITVSEDSR